MLLTNPEDWLMPTPVHLLLLSLVLCALAWRARRRGGSLARWRWFLSALAAWCWVTATPALAHRLAAALEDDYPPFDAAAQPLDAPPVILVLAAGDSHEPSLPGELQLNLASYRRTQLAADIWHRTGGILLFSGRSRHDDARPIAQRMAELAQRLGVPRDAMAVEAESLNTWQNLRASGALLDGARPVLLVTSAMHMPRAMAAAQALGLRAIAAPADFRAHRALGWRAWLPNSRALPLLGMALHEWMGRAWYALRGSRGLSDER